MDIQIEDHGSIILFRPLTVEATTWLQENTDGQWFGGALAVEPRYAGALEDGALSDGLTVH
jgi:hypothetical protein